MTYRSFAYIYDRLMEDVPYDAWVTFVREQADAYDVTCKRMLDIACGTGELSIRLARAGYEVTAIDQSVDMLTVAENKAFEQGVTIPFFKQDMRALEHLGDFDCVTIFCDSLNYLATEEEVLASFRGAYEQLRPGGLFLFDVHSLYKISDIFMNETFGLNDEDISYVWHSYAGENPNSIEHELTFFVLDEGSGQYTRFDELHEQRTFPITSYTDLLARAGFDLKEITADFTSERPSDTSERIFFTAQKREK